MDEHDDRELKDHRRWLVQTYTEACRGYDKAIMTFASGAIGVSILFLDDVFPNPQNTVSLRVSWLLLGASLLAVIGSFLTSQAALLWSMRQMDAGNDAGRGGPWGTATDWLNWTSGATFLGGVGFLVCFAWSNLGGK